MQMQISARTFNCVYRFDFSFRVFDKKIFSSLLVYLGITVDVSIYLYIYIIISIIMTNDE